MGEPGLSTRNGWKGLLEKAGLIGLVGLGVVAGTNISAIERLRTDVDRLSGQAVEIAVMHQRLAELERKIDQLQAVVIETRNAVLGRR